MKRNTITIVTMLALFSTVLLSSCSQENPLNALKEDVQAVQPVETPKEEIIPGKYIVIFKQGTVPEKMFKQSMSDEQRALVVTNVAGDILAGYRIDIPAYDQVYCGNLQGFAATLSNEDLRKLSSDPNIEFIEQDRVVTYAKGGNGGGGSGGGGGGVTQPPQTTPAGITRVGGPGNAGSRKAWIIDSGIELNHPDLLINTTLSKSFISRTSAGDQFGHGTMVAGIIGAKNNTIGTVGVAAGCTLVAVKVIDVYGGGTISGIVAGIDYVGTKAVSGDVANMSLGTSASASIDTAVARASRKGIYFALAAGNSAANAGNYSPARLNAPRVFTVSAMDATDTWASFSNFGNPPVDYCEPGVSIYTTSMGNTYTNATGTSFAAPHLAGILLVTGGSPATSGNVSGDPDGTADPIGHL